MLNNFQHIHQTLTKRSVRCFCNPLPSNNDNYFTISVLCFVFSLYFLVFPLDESGSICIPVEIYVNLDTRHYFADCTFIYCFPLFLSALFKWPVKYERKKNICLFVCVCVCVQGVEDVLREYTLLFFFADSHTVNESEIYSHC